MANKLILTPITTAVVANLMTKGYRAMDAVDVFPMLQMQPSQKICVIICDEEIEDGPALQKYHWVIFSQSRVSANTVMDAGLRDSHHSVTLKQMV